VEARRPTRQDKIAGDLEIVIGDAPISRRRKARKHLRIVERFRWDSVRMEHLALTRPASGSRLAHSMNVTRAETHYRSLVGAVAAEADAYLAERKIKGTTLKAKIEALENAMRELNHGGSSEGILRLYGTDQQRSFVTAVRAELIPAARDAISFDTQPPSPAARRPSAPEDFGRLLESLRAKHQL
jgi:hypothetical protein